MKTSTHHSLAATGRFDKKKKIRLCSSSGVINGSGSTILAWFGVALYLGITR
jgi:hypothetical protein